MEIAFLIGITGALGCFALGLGVFVLGAPSSAVVGGEEVSGPRWEGSSRYCKGVSADAH
jgi:hypothetical protein